MLAAGCSWITSSNKSSKKENLQLIDSKRAYNCSVSTGWAGGVIYPNGSAALCGSFILWISQASMSTYLWGFGVSKTPWSHCLWVPSPWTNDSHEVVFVNRPVSTGVVLSPTGSRPHCAKRKEHDAKLPETQSDDIVVDWEPALNNSDHDNSNITWGISSHKLDKFGMPHSTTNFWETPCV